jgi:hypothetical protein
MIRAGHVTPQEAEQAVLYALRGRSGVTFAELLGETGLSRQVLSAALFRLSDRITYEEGVYMPTGVYPRKPRTTAAPTSRHGRRPRTVQTGDGAVASGGNAGGTTDIDYGLVLADLRARRAQLDAAIASLETLVGGRP